MQKYLSIFIDESGDFGKFNSIAPYYLVTMLFHNQSNNIAKEIVNLDNSLDKRGYANHYLHTGPLIRKEEVYELLSIDERKHILNSFMAFATRVDFTYKTFIVEKGKDIDQFKLISLLSKQIRDFLDCHVIDFSDFEKVIVYYDNGQTQLTSIMASLLTASNIEFRRNARPSYYRLFQIADLLTTFELINKKRENNKNSKSETNFFGSMRNFYKNYYKRLLIKKID